MLHRLAFCRMHPTWIFLPHLKCTTICQRIICCYAAENSGDQSTFPIKSFQHLAKACSMPSFCTLSMLSISITWVGESLVVEVV